MFCGLEEGKCPPSFLNRTQNGFSAKGREVHEVFILCRVGVHFFNRRPCGGDGRVAHADTASSTKRLINLGEEGEEDGKIFFPSSSKLVRLSHEL